MGFTDLNKKNADGTSNVSIKGPMTNFGEVAVAQPTPVAQGDFVYNVNDRIFNTDTIGGATIASGSGMAEVNSGTNSNGCGTIRLRRGLKYKPGQGSLVRATAIFGTPVANNKQLVGAGNDECGYYFGYSGTNFGIIHDEKGSREIRQLTIEQPIATTTATITLNGNSLVVPVTGGNDLSQIAYQISLADYSGVGDGWLADAIGESVYFSSQRSAAGKTGAYTAAGTASLGTFAQTQAGEDLTTTFITQSSWNMDTMDGNGPSGMALDKTKGNVYQIGFQYLGFGNAQFAIEDSATGFLTKVHELRLDNARTDVVLKNPNISPLIQSLNDGSTTNVTLKSASMAAFTEGKIRKLDPKFAKVLTFATDTDNDFNDQPILAIKSNEVFNGRSCFGEFDLLAVTVSNESTSKTLSFGVFQDVEIGGEVNFEYVDSTNSVVSTATLVPGTNTMTNNPTPIAAFSVGPGEAKIIDLADLEFVFGPGRAVCLAFKSSSNIVGDLSLIWYEQQ